MTAASARQGPTIHLELFEGPLELLLSLVERRRLPITDVSLATVADQYLRQVRALAAIDCQALADFLQIAARLLQIKSRALLPSLGPTNGEEEESAERLVERLEAYRIVKSLAASLAAREETDLGAFARASIGIVPEALMGERLAAIPPGLLARLVAEVESRAPVASSTGTVIVARSSVAERMLHLRGRLAERGQVAWVDVAGGTVDSIIATLLAVLEMLRRGELSVHQDALFGPISLRGIDQSSIAKGSGALLGEAELP